MSERFNQVEAQPHHHAEIERAAAERLKQLERSPEQHESKEASVEAAREQLVHIEAAPSHTEVTPVAEPSAPRAILSKSANYRQTMVTLRHRLGPTSRSFSKLIHTPIVEKTSAVIGSTVLRPSVSLGATTTAVFLTGFIYLYARHYGFLLRGSEIWITLILGGVLGLFIEAVYKLLFRRSAPDA